MSKAPDLKNDYDKVLLIVVAFAAAATAIYMQSASRESAVLSPARSSGDALEPDATLETLQTDRKLMQAKKPWRETEASPFASRVYLLKDGRLVDISAPGNDLYPGIPNVWLIDNGFDDELVDNLPELDADSDGFTNREEFDAKTNPRDSASIPAEWTKLRLADVKIEQLQIIFTGRTPDGRAMINSVAVSEGASRGQVIGSTKTYSLHDTVEVVKGFAAKNKGEKTPFRLKEIGELKRKNPRIMDKNGRPQEETINVAILESLSGDGTTVTLEPQTPVTSPYSLATLVDIRLGGQQFLVRSGEVFSPSKSVQYKLVDVSEEKATIKNLVSGEEHIIPRAVPVASGQTPPTSPQSP